MGLDDWIDILNRHPVPAHPQEYEWTFVLQIE